MMFRPFSQRILYKCLTPAMQGAQRLRAFTIQVLPAHNQISALSALIDETGRRVAAAEAKLEGTRERREFETVPFLQQERIALLTKENQLREEKLILLRPGAGQTGHLDTGVTRAVDKTTDAPNKPDRESGDSAHMAAELREVQASVREITDELHDFMAKHSNQTSKYLPEKKLVLEATEPSKRTEELEFLKSRITELETKNVALRRTKSQWSWDNIALGTFVLLAALMLTGISDHFELGYGPPLVVLLLVLGLYHVFVN